METISKNIFIVAGEASGDQHAAELCEKLKSFEPNIRLSGLGGPQMAKAGVHLFYDLAALALIGFWEVLKSYSEIKRVFHLFLEKVDATKPDAVILVDYPGFNLRLAKELKKRNIKVIYYISPQLWAWKESRIKQIRKNVDHMLVLFEFEVDFYKKHGIDVTFAGNPLLDQVTPTKSRKEVLKEVGLSSDALTIGLLPGSRKKEIESLLPVMCQTADRLSDSFQHIQFLVLQSQTLDDELIENHLDYSNANIRVIKGDHYNALNACDLCIVASGTATLETAILTKPMIVIYKTSPLTYFLAKLFVKIPNLGLVNIVAGKRIVPELIQHNATAQRISTELTDIIVDEIRIAEIKDGLRKVKASLGEPGASERAAEAILNILS